MADEKLYRSTINLVGVSHKTLSVEGREALARVTGGKPGKEALRELAMKVGLKEGALISTCNRFEVISVGDDREDSIVSFLGAALPNVPINTAVYRLKDREAVRHLFKVAGSLDSLAVGEAQILGQVKDAYNDAVGEKFAGRYLHSLFQFAFRLAKRVKGETAVSERGISVSYIAVQLSARIFEDLSDKSVLIIGSGKMAELTALHLKNKGCTRIVVANRTLERAVELASQLGGSAIRLDEIGHALEQVDMVIGSIYADATVLDVNVVKRRKKRSPLFLIDLGVPRNFSPALGEIDGVYLYNIDDLGKIADENRSLREEASKDAEVIIDYGVFRFESWLRRVGNASTVVGLRERIRELCTSELENAFRRRPEDLELGVITDKVSHAISQKVSHLVQEILGTLQKGEQDLQREGNVEEILPLVFDEILKFGSDK